MLGALGTTLFFAITPVFANRAARQLGSIPGNVWRLVIAAGVLGVWALGFGHGLAASSRSWFFLGGLAGFGVGGVAMFLSLPRLGSALSTLIVQTVSVIAAAALEYAWLGTRLTPIQIGCGLVTLAGITIGMLPRSLPRIAAADFTSGVAWAFVSAAGQGVGAVLSRKAFAVAAARHELIDPGTATFHRVLGGLAIAAIALIACVAAKRAEVVRDRAAWPWVIGNALTGPILGVTCYQWALRTTPAAIVQSVVATAPLLTVPLAIMIERAARPRLAYYLGAALAIFGATRILLPG